ncbi:SDR family oxidoreductase [Amorphus sp. 3PC139-8]|uniref:SDR family oxidoreductase n=1 Tax=Amorphus sp. 3PC139-8 TaxID=2735676 RepID=UPI00345D942D
MDLGIAGKRALVCASSRGLGRGCAEALAEAGCALVMNGRSVDVLRKTADEVGEVYGTDVTAVAADITKPEGREEVLSQAGEIDILVTNAAGPPPGNWIDWDRDDFISAFDANMLTPIALMQALMPSMMERKWGRVVNITSEAVKSPRPRLGLSNSARTGLTGFVAGTARQVAQDGVIINNLLPGLHATDRASSLDAGMAKSEGIDVDEVTRRKQAAIPARRYGSPEEFGRVCAFLCSTHAGYIVGQNILVDGGAANITF